MKVVILAGGLGTRISEESHLRPKPMIEIGDKPILWHVMKIYSHFGFHDFVILLGYKGYTIKEYFSDYFLHNSNVTFDFRGERTKMVIHNHRVEPWTVTLVDTGSETQTGGRVRRAREYLEDEPFFLTYGDGVGDVNIAATLLFHREHGKQCTVTAVQPTGRFGVMDIDSNDSVLGFQEKPKGDRNWISAGFFVMEPSVIDRIDGDLTVLEREPLESLARNKDLVAYKHDGFWHPMDTMRDKAQLEELWKSGNAPWALWNKSDEGVIRTDVVGL